MGDNNKHKIINILGDTQREQWHTIVSMINWRTDGSVSELCKELHRYIDFCEDKFDELRKEN